MAAKKTAKTTAKKTASKAVVKKNAAKKNAKKAAPPSPDEIAKAAYLNYRRRVENGLPGDTHGDWLEAENQLSRES